MSAGGAAGKKNVYEAIAQLKRLDVGEYLSSVRGRQGKQEINPRSESAPGVEWRLRKWEDSDVAVGAQYTLSRVFLSREEGMSMLWDDKDFNEFLMRKVTATTPVHLMTTLCKVSRVADALNCSTKICPNIIDWLMEAKKVTEDWVCPDNEDDDVGCEFQHDCAGGLQCDVEGCVLFHPDEETRWVVLINNTSVWAEAMTFDEASIYQPKGGARVRALDDTPECTNTEVWRASFPARAFGRTRIPTSTIAAPAASPATTPPVPAVTAAGGEKTDAAAGEAAAKGEEPTGAVAAAVAKPLTDPAKKAAAASVTDVVIVEDEGEALAEDGEDALKVEPPPATAPPAKKTKTSDEAEALTVTTGKDEGLPTRITWLNGLSSAYVSAGGRMRMSCRPRASSSS